MSAVVLTAALFLLIRAVSLTVSVLRRPRSGHHHWKKHWSAWRMGTYYRCRRCQIAAADLAEYPETCEDSVRYERVRKVMEG